MKSKYFSDPPSSARLDSIQNYCRVEWYLKFKSGTRHVAANCFRTFFFKKYPFKICFSRGARPRTKISFYFTLNQTLNFASATAVTPYKCVKENRANQCWMHWFYIVRVAIFKNTVEAFLRRIVTMLYQYSRSIIYV